VNPFIVDGNKAAQVAIQDLENIGRLMIQKISTNVGTRTENRRPMKKHTILFCLALIATVPICFGQTKSSQPQLAGAKETAVADLEKSAWEAYKNKQGDAFRKLLAKDYCGAYAEGIKNVDGEIADMEKGELRKYSFADMKVVFPSPGRRGDDIQSHDARHFFHWAGRVRHIQRCQRLRSARRQMARRLSY
jgi:hypothetical protein